jgi:hypothetical protein
MAMSQRCKGRRFQDVGSVQEGNGKEDCVVSVDKVVCVLTVGVSMMLGIGSVCCERGRLRWL